MTNLLSPRSVSRIDQFIGLRLKALRERHAMSPEEFAAWMGLSAAGIERCETGEQRLATRDMMRIANRCDLPMGYFFC